MRSNKTSLYDRHIEAGARMVNFSGWAMPIQYAGILTEAKSTRSGASVLDASHMGEIEVSGKGALDFLQNLLTNDLALAGPCQIQYNLIVNPAGGIIDDCVVYALEDKFLCVVNASNKDKVLSWFNKHKTGQLEIVDCSEQYGLISVQGPQAQRIVTKLIGLKR